MKRSPVLLGASIVELLRVLLIAAAARALFLQTGNQLTIAVLRALIAGSFVFPALLALAWFEKRFEHYVYLFIPLKFICVLIDAVSIISLLTVRGSSASALSLGPLQTLAGALAVTLIDAFILVVAFLQLRKPEKPEEPAITIEQVEL